MADCHKGYGVRIASKSKMASAILAIQQKIEAVYAVDTINKTEGRPHVKLPFQGGSNSGRQSKYCT